VKLQDSYREVQGIELWWMCRSLIGGLTLRVRDQGLFRREQWGPVSGSTFTEGGKEKQEWVVISAWGLLSWPWTHFMA
jgi:hypothetical protein